MDAGGWVSQTNRERVKERICCEVKMDDVKLILEVEKQRRFV